MKNQKRLKIKRMIRNGFRPIIRLVRDDVFSVLLLTEDKGAGTGPQCQMNLDELIELGYGSECRSRMTATAPAGFVVHN